MTIALLIIDVQQALCSGPYEAFDSGPVIERINLVSRRAGQAGTPVVVIQHESPDGPLADGTAGRPGLGSADPPAMNPRSPSPR